MADNGTDQKTTVLAQIAAVLQDHWDLITLEMGYESKQAARRLMALGVSFLFVLLAMIVAQVAVIYGLMNTGMSPALACVWVAMFYGLVGVVVYLKWGRRDPRGGAAFTETRREVAKTLSWIQKLFS